MISEVKNKSLVLGCGFLGKSFRKAGFKVLSKEEFDIKINNEKSVYDLDKYLSEYDYVVNCIGKSNTRWCEDSKNLEEVLWSNGFVPRILSEYCARNNKKFIHISTGYLYDSNRVENKETDFITAHCNYTATKWIGEKFCNLSRDLILRPRLYFGDFEDKNNLIHKLYKFNNFLDELNSLSSVNMIVDVTNTLLNFNQVGIFNVSCDGHITIYELANAIGIQGKKIKEADLHNSENLFLVNNIMDISKLKKFYSSPNIFDEFKRCSSVLKGDDK